MIQQEECFNDYVDRSLLVNTPAQAGFLLDILKQAEGIRFYFG